MTENEVEKNYIQVQVYLDKPTLELLKQIKEDTGAPVSTLVRKAVHKVYKTNEEKRIKQ